MQPGTPPVYSRSLIVSVQNPGSRVLTFEMHNFDQIRKKADPDYPASMYGWLYIIDLSKYFPIEESGASF